MCVGLIGVGRWGRHLARNFYQMGVLGALSDLHHPSLFPMVPWSQDPSALLKNKALKQIAIATPPDTHYFFAKEALLAGRDVFVEKPLCLVLDQAEELVALAQRQGTILMVGHLLHYHPCIPLLKKIISSGQLGEIQEVLAVRSTPHSSGTSALWDLGPHDVSLLLSLFGYPIDIFFEGGERECRLMLAFTASFQADIVLRTGRREQILSIVGSLAKATFSSNEVLTLTSGEIFRFEEEPLRRECEHFLECCRTRTPPLTEGNEALEVVRVLQCAEEKRFLAFV